jgi:cytochrome c oxidase cbb3-type subunit III
VKSVGVTSIGILAAILWRFFAVGAPNSLAVQRNGGMGAPSGTGEQSFVTYCSTCHGIDGRGGEHAPAIAHGPSVQELSDARLLSILRNGIPSGGMPSFRTLGSARLKLIINYLRALQGIPATSAVSGNPLRGRTLFFGSARCSDCHMIHGVGGFLGPDLSSYSLSHSSEEIRDAILNPNKNLSLDSDTVVAIARDGRKFVGIARNEDNFSLQLLSPDGSVHLLLKSGLAAVHHQPWSLMPSDYRSKLSKSDLNDLISYLVKSASHTSQAEQQGPARAERGSDE